MRIALAELTSGSRFNIYTLFQLPRLGLPLLGALLRAEGHKVDIFCESVSRFNPAVLLGYDLVGYSAITCTINRTYQQISQLKNTRPNLPIVIGGPHVSELSEEALRAGADYVVRREGERTVIALAEAVRAGAIPYWVEGLSLRYKEQIQHNPERNLLTEEELDTLPFADIRLIQGHERIRQTPLMASRGCPYNCKYCHVCRQFGQQYRVMSIERQLAELEWLKSEMPERWQACSIFFYDDNRFAHKPRAKRVMEEMLRRNLVPPRGWTCQMRVDSAVDAELVRLMAQAGCTWVYLGIESFDQAVLKEYRKHQDISAIFAGMSNLTRFGIKRHVMLMAGADGDTPETIRRNVELASRLGATTLQVMATIPLPGTPLRADWAAQGRILPLGWDKYDGHSVVHRPAKMSPARLKLEIDLASAWFYLVRRGCHLVSQFGFKKFLTVLFRWLSEEVRKCLTRFSAQVNRAKCSKRLSLP